MTPPGRNVPAAAGSLEVKAHPVRKARFIRFPASDRQLPAGKRDSLDTDAAPTSCEGSCKSAPATADIKNALAFLKVELRGQARQFGHLSLR